MRSSAKVPRRNDSVQSFNSTCLRIYNVAGPRAAAAQRAGQQECRVPRPHGPSCGEKFNRYAMFECQKKSSRVRIDCMKDRSKLAPLATAPGTMAKGAVRTAAGTPAHAAEHRRASARRQGRPSAKPGARGTRGVEWPLLWCRCSGVPTESRSL